MSPQQQLQCVSHLKSRLPNPDLSYLDRSHVLYELGSAQLHMFLMEPTNITESCHEAIDCFRECFRLRFHILIDHELVKEAWWALVRARKVLSVLEESYEETSGVAPAA